MPTKKTFYKTIYLPIELIEDIENQNFTTSKSGELNKAYHLISILQEKSYKDLGKMCDLYDISRNYLRTVFGGNYYNIINPLVNDDIIKVQYSASKDAGRTNKYGLNYEYFKRFGETKRITFRYKQVVNNDESAGLEEFKTFYELLNIDRLELLNVLDKKLNEINSEEYNINEQITERGVITYSNGYTSKIGNTEKLIKDSATSEKNLIEDNGSYFFMTIDDYKNLKTYYINNSWLSHIEDLANGNLRCVKDDKGNREHTNLTNLPTELRESIFQASGIVNLDISNSQFAFFAHHLKKIGLDNLDAINFIKHCQNGTIYEFIQQELNLNSRKEAKKLMFLINFSGNSFKSDLKDRFSKRFPSISAFIFNYNKENGNKSFPIFLQRLESDFILNQVRPQLKNNNIISASIHDSICVKEEDSAQTLEIIKEIMQDLNFKAVIKIENQIKQAI